MRGSNGIILHANQSEGRTFLERIGRKNPLFVCVIGNTETAKIPGLSAAGESPELIDFTPAADVELLCHGSCRCIKGAPITPDGIPTPALIARSALTLGNIGVLVACSGAKVRPNLPFVHISEAHGADIRLGNAVPDAEDILRRSKLLGGCLSKSVDYLVVGESIPGGTTTAMAVLLAMGIEARGRISSSMKKNPHELKNRVVSEGMKAGGVGFGELADDPITAMQRVGDPVMPAIAGLAIGAGENIPVLLAGGTQMTAVIAAVSVLRPEALPNLAIGTTRWLVNDEQSDLSGILSETGNVPVLAADLNMETSRFPGLRAYEDGVVKEGVGAGGSSIAAMVKSGNTSLRDRLLEEIEKNYERLRTD
jgi:uncharacterized protein (TIGR00303 family)